MGCIAYLNVSESDGKLVAVVAEQVNQINKEVSDVNAPSTTRDLEPDRTAARDEDQPLPTPVQSGRGSDHGSAGRGASPASVSGDRPIAEGKRGDSSVDQATAGARSNQSAQDATGGTERDRSDDTGQRREPDVDRGDPTRDQGVDDKRVVGDSDKPDPDPQGAEAGLSLEEKVKIQAAAESLPHTDNDLENIRETLPVLLPPQQEDVKFAEERFSQPDGHGVLFTNGTGTGKTFTGLGIVKRFARQGKDNVLIVVPSDKIARDWASSARHLKLAVKQLSGIEDNGGAGVVVTTYANFYQNRTLLERDWDLVVPDESHKINQNKAGTVTQAERMLGAVTGMSLQWRAYMPDYAKWAKLQRDIDRKRAKPQFREGKKQLPFKHFTEAFSYPFDGHGENAKDSPTMAPFYRRWTKLDGAATKRLEKLAKRYRDKEGRPLPSKVAFLSATPFAYHKSLRYADGFLFDSSLSENKKRKGGYNVAQGFEAFLQENLGYQMRTGKLNQPSADVNVSLAERNLNEAFKKSGVLRGRRLKVDADYSRQFVLIDNAIGKKIDEGMKWLWDNSEAYPGLSAQLNERFNYLARLQLLEAIKAEHGVERAKQHIKLGRKVVMFHDFKQGGSFNHPFKFKVTQEVTKEVLARFNEARPDLLELPLDHLPSPIDAVRQAFGDSARIFNGDVPSKERNKAVNEFNDDDGSVNVILIQRDAGKEGISLHDTTGQYQRVLLDLGLPTKPTDAIQTEGRIYRTGVMTNAIDEYFTTGLDYETHAFADAVASRSSTAENLAMGHEGRNLLRAFVDAYSRASAAEPSLEQGVGGKQQDYENTEVSPLESAKLAYFTRQKNTKNRRDREGKEYYATPEPVGMVMADWLQLAPGEYGLEPSAGHGAIARSFPSHASNTFIEPSYELRGELGMLGAGTVKGDDFLTFRPARNFEGIAMNPPYGQGGAQAVKHVAKAFSHLRPGGRVVALIPDGGSADKKFDQWSESAEAKEAYPVIEVKLPSVTFNRAGTGVRTKLVVFDRVPDRWRKAGAEMPDHRRVDLSYIEDINELFERLGDIELGERVAEPDALKSPKPAAQFSQAVTETGTTVEDLRHELATKVRGLKLLEKTGKVQLVQSASELPVRADASTAGLYHHDTVYLVADNLTAGEAYGVFLHEAGEHAGLESMLGADKYSQVVQQFERLLDNNNVDALRAVERVPESTPDAQVASERLAYLVEDFTNQAVKSGGAKMLVQRLMAAVKAWAVAKLPKWMTRKIKLTPADIQALAVRGARHWASRQEPSQGAEKTQFSQKPSFKDSVKKVLEAQRLREVYDKKTGEYRIEGVKWQDMAGLMWRRVSDMAAKAGEASLYLQSFNVLLDRNKKYFKRFAEEGGRNPLEAIEEYKRLMNAVVQHWADRYQKAQDQYKALSAKQQQRVSMMMHDATMAGVHPDRGFVADSSLQAKGKRLAAADYLKQLEGQLAAIDADQRRMTKNRSFTPQQALEESVTLKRRIKHLKRRMKHERNRRMEYARLKQRWNSLSESEQAVYQAWNHELNKLWEKQQTSIEQKIADLKGMSQEDKSAAKTLLTELREEHRKQMELGPYFPLRRYGDYQLLIKRSEGEYERYHFERRSEALDVQAKIEQEDPHASVRLLTDYKDVGGQFKDVPGAAGRLLKLFGEEAKGSVAPEVRETINRFVVNALPEVSARKAEMRRFFVTGASADMERSFAHAMLHGGHDISRIMFAHKVTAEVERIHDQVALHERVLKGSFDDEPLKKQAAEDNSLIDPKDLVQVTQFLNVLRKQVDGMMNPDTNQIAAFSGNFAFFWYLAGSPGAAIANLTQVPQIAYPLMASHFGMGATRRELQRAYADIAKSMKPVSNVVQGKNPLNWQVRDSVFDAANAEHLTQEERDVLRAMEMDSTTDTTQANSMASVASGDGKAKIGSVALKAEKVMALTGFWFHNAEVLNRQVVQLATYRLMQQADTKTQARIKKLHGEEGSSGLDMARWMTTRTQYDYSHSNRALLLKGNLAKTLTPLMNYSFLTLELMLTRVRDVINAENDPELKKMARQELLGIMGMTALMGGTRALPLGAVYLLINGLFDDEDEPFDAEAAWGEFLKDSFGQVLGDEGGEMAANLVTRGAVNALPLVGFDLSSRISMANLLFNNPDVAAEGGDTVKALLVDVMGVNASTLVNAAEGLRLLGEGNTQRGLEKLSPKFVRDISKAQRYASEGVVSAKGDVVIHPDDLSWYDVVLQSQGLAPSDVVRTYDKRNAKRTLAKKLELRRKGLMNRYARARMDGQGDVAKVLREIEAFNRVNRYAGITHKQLNHSIKRRMRLRAKKSGDAGLYIADRYRRQLMEMGYE